MLSYKSIRVEKNNDFILVKSYLTRILSIINPYQDFIFYALTIPDEFLGEVVKIKLDESKELNENEFQELFKSNDVKDLPQKLILKMKELFGYKNKKAIYKDMDFLSIALVDNEIIISPLHQDSLDGYTAIYNSDGSGLEFIYSSNISNKALGKAVREAFKYCTSIYRR